MKIFDFSIGFISASFIYFIVIKTLVYKLDKDFITRLPNYKGLLSYLNKLTTKKKDSCILILDLNNFRIHNKKGYEYGDYKLRDFADKLKKLFTKDCFVARYRTGDEFILVFDSQKYNDIIEKINTLNYSDSKSLSTGLFCYATSQGILDSLSLQALIEEAEKKLLQNKLSIKSSNNIE